MLDIFTLLWAWVAGLFTDARFLAALPALVVSWGTTKDLKTSALVAFIAFSTINLIIWITSIIPPAGVYTLPVPAAAGVGTFMGLIGLKGIKKRADSLDVGYIVKTSVNHVAKAIKDRTP